MVRTAAARDQHRPATFQAWYQAVAAFHVAIDRAYPAGFWLAMGRRYERLAAGDAHAVEMAVLFLEADQWFFRSGYVKEALIRRLKRLPLTPTMTERLRQVVLQAVDGRDRREFRRYCWLAHSVANVDLQQALRERKESPDPDIRRRAEWALAAIEHRPVDAALMQAHADWYRRTVASIDAEASIPPVGKLRRPMRRYPHQPRHVQYGYGGTDLSGWRG